MIVRLINGTYELFRQYYGLQRQALKSQPLGAVAGVLGTVIKMLEGGPGAVLREEGGTLVMTDQRLARCLSQPA